MIDGKVVNCGRDERIEMIILDNKEQLLSLDAINNAVETRDLHLDARYKTVEEATGHDHQLILLMPSAYLMIFVFPHL